MERRFAARHFVDLLQRIDAELEKPITVVAIGGAVLGLTCLDEYVTTDLDVISTREPAFWSAVDRARAKMADPPLVQAVSIHQPPYDFEDRLTPFPIPGAAKLTVLIPDLHDVALMKMGRGEEHDLAALEGVHAIRPFSLEQLVSAYVETRVQYIGRVSELKLNFLALVARLFGAGYGGQDRSHARRVSETSCTDRRFPASAALAAGAD